jgi:hypothetical protein
MTTCQSGREMALSTPKADNLAWCGRIFLSALSL